MADKPKVSISVPQLFYDLISRIVPGFIFLLILNYELTYTFIELKPLINLDINSTDGIMIALGSFVSLIIICYFIGFILQSFGPYRNREFLAIQELNDDKIKNDKVELKQKVFRQFFNPLNKTTKENLIIMKKELRHIFRLLKTHDVELGYRILKLRAEAFMLSAIRFGMCFQFLIIFIFNWDSDLIVLNIFKIIIPLLFFIGSHFIIKQYWKRFYTAIIGNYEGIQEYKAKNGIPTIKIAERIDKNYKNHKDNI